MPSGNPQTSLVCPEESKPMHDLDSSRQQRAVLGLWKMRMGRDCDVDVFVTWVKQPKLQKEGKLSRVVARTTGCRDASTRRWELPCIFLSLGGGLFLEEPLCGVLHTNPSIREQPVLCLDDAAPCSCFTRPWCFCSC